MTTARANLDALAPQYRSKTEGYWAGIGEIYIADEFDARVVHTEYQPFILHLDGHNYEPDFLHILETGQQVIVEVKGSRKHKGYVTTRIKLKSAAKKFPYWTFVEVVGGRRGFEIEVIN